jgi:hypothetical protein
MLCFMFAEDFNCQSFKKIILYFIKNTFVKTNIRPDIRYPAFGLAGYPAGRISGKNSIRCIPKENCSWASVRK